MIRNKIVIGLGLMLGLAAGVSYANSLGGSQGEIKPSSPFVLSLGDKLDAAPNKYNITCQVNNVHNSASLKAVIELANGSLSSVTTNQQDKTVEGAGVKKFIVPLADGMNTLVLENVVLGSVTEERDELVKAAYDDPQDPIQKRVRVWFSPWYKPLTHITVSVPQAPRHIDATYRKVVVTSSNDQLTFSALDEHMTQLGTGYVIGDCSAAVVQGASTPSSTDAPVADVPAVDATPVADAPVSDVPAADAPVADAPVADVTPAADAPVADMISPANPA